MEKDIETLIPNERKYCELYKKKAILQKMGAHKVPPLPHHHHHFEYKL